MLKKKILVLILLSATSHSSDLIGFNRSIFRPKQSLPEITTFWKDDPTHTHTLKDSHLEAGIFTIFDKDFFYEHMLPQGEITYRNDPKKSVTGAQLSEIIENLLVELKQKKKRFKDFEILKQGDYSFLNFCGLIVLRFKKYPFVLKLFIENPESFVHPYSKGIQPCSFFVMGGGIMRHLTGFTRIKNLEILKKNIATDPFWAQIIDTPRKWHWLPKENRWLTVIGKNIGENHNKTISMELPSIYAVIADEIKINKRKTIFNQSHALRCMRFCQFTNYQVDPHIQNFRIESNTGKLVLIDTENFRALVGLKEQFLVDSYLEWYSRLTKKYLRERFFRNKEERRLAQLRPTWQ
jgi:hypothetical protein